MLLTSGNLVNIAFTHSFEINNFKCFINSLTHFFTR
ncbi:Uncharacterised protein [Vibrio cholerae]|nr:Uncharacterised protein [Vibrio cholerae]